MSSRLFVSVDLPGDLAEEVAAVQERFDDASGLKFTDPEQAHVTLKFLGDVRKSSALSSQSEPQSDSDDVSDDRVAAVEDAVSAAVDDAGVGPFSARFEGLGVFPSLEYISVLWLGVAEGGDELARLHEAIEDRTTDLGFDPEDHEFTPHVTLARMEHAGGKELVQRGVREWDPTVGEATVESVRLTESELTSDGPVYSTVERFQL